MTILTAEHVFTGTLTEVYAGVRDFEEYPKVLPGVTGIEVLPAKKPNSTCQVRYALKLIKTFQYTLDMFEEAPKRMWWKLDSSNLMKVSNGSWTLSELPGGQTKALYSLEVGFSGFVPQAIVDQVSKANLPGLMVGMQKIIDQHRTA